jgi:hypothetical protein
LIDSTFLGESIFDSTFLGKSVFTLLILFGHTSCSNQIDSMGLRMRVLPSAVIFLSQNSFGEMQCSVTGRVE